MGRGEFFYHGTGEGNVPGIMRNGFNKNEYPYTYITPDEEEAEEYARMANESGGGKGAVIKCVLKKGSEPMEEFGMDASAFRSEDITPVSYRVLGAEWISRKSNNKPKKRPKSGPTGFGEIR
jgi:hypothetical protein